MPKTNPERKSELIASDWIQLREPQNIVSIGLLMVPIMALSALATVKIFNIFTAFSLADFGITSHGLSATISLKGFAGLMGLLLSHELLHLIFIPNFIRSEKTYLGITYYGGYVYSEESLPKLRYILITIAPFLIISAALPLILGFLGLLTPMAKILILLNSMGSCMDVMNLGFVLSQVPAAAYITCNGTETYWKRKE
ncbi:TPA: DUF3267 domain-containing protein [Methanosarcina acetivorans]|uniref:DUF3267 domain-containing protein n=2 Tax=Methanosarcina acetivorans TaxID=2214 RepID=Q8TSQ5_METAC|nr:DUF3267 domain-containing protein [Methanosarcina acetivorans]AAM04180.1 predicted protein [Methanosarcina acetivorans C2A]HIH95525.1 DUF3267 domain-containing protein [Methanosarcina acetivorans]